MTQINQVLMKTHTTSSDTTSHTFLTGAILFANLDYSGLAAYAVKAAIGGAIWMVFKLAGDYLSYRLLRNKRSKSEHFEMEGKEDNL
jgi:hypothetical protein